jgi:glutamate N-acetyltransferase/amino-acid N-acetyltransferase
MALRAKKTAAKKTRAKKSTAKKTAVKKSTPKKTAPAKSGRPAKSRKPAQSKISVSPVRGGVTAPIGFKAAGIRAGIKSARKPDFAAIVSDPPAAAAGAFTKNAIRASSVDWCAGILPAPDISAIVCTSGCANACTGPKGIHDNATVASLTAAALKTWPKRVLTASTGTIGKYLPVNRIKTAMPKLISALSEKHSGGTDFAQAIMTTDLEKKESAVRVKCGKGSFTIGGVAKGSGMIHPNMATMLCFITTDAEIDEKLLDKIVKRVVDRTFNNLTVDGDTSTNDMVLVMANGASGILVRRAIALANPEARKAQQMIPVDAFEEALFAVCNDLCKKIAADGEGATKRVEINISGARTEAEAKLAAKAVANSNLTKCALFGNDPNWGRIACAVGYSGAQISKKLMSIKLCGIKVFENLLPVPFDADKLHTLLKKKVVNVDVDLGMGKVGAVAHTCDLSYDYVKINAEYHT